MRFWASRAWLKAIALAVALRGLFYLSSLSPPHINQTCINHILQMNSEYLRGWFFEQEMKKIREKEKRRERDFER